MIKEYEAFVCAMYGIGLGAVMVAQDFGKLPTGVGIVLLCVCTALLAEELTVEQMNKKFSQWGDKHE